MSVTIKSAREIELMREAGNILAIVHNELEHMIKPGITAMDLNKKAQEIIKSYDCKPSFLNYNGFPAAICVSKNDVIVHGIPSNDVVFQEGDIVSIDAGVIYQGYHSDAARTWAVGEVPEDVEKLIRVTKECFFEGIKYAKDGNRLFEISAAIQKHAESNGFSVVRELVGHGIGAHLHERPEIPNYKQAGKGVRLRAGMTLAIEPMINIGTRRIKFAKDGWAVKTADGKYSSHYENTILITEGEPELLSIRKK